MSEEKNPAAVALGKLGGVKVAKLALRNSLPDRGQSKPIKLLRHVGL
jgi:hypothetical protein